MCNKLNCKRQWSRSFKSTKKASRLDDCTKSVDFTPKKESVSVIQWQSRLPMEKLLIAKGTERREKLCAVRVKLKNHSINCNTFTQWSRSISNASSPTRSYSETVFFFKYQWKVEETKWTGRIVKSKCFLEKNFFFFFLWIEHTFHYWDCTVRVWWYEMIIIIAISPWNTMPSVPLRWSHLIKTVILRAHSSVHYHKHSSA